MRLWLTLTTAILLVPSIANAAEYGKVNRLETQVEKLNARIERLETDLQKARADAAAQLRAKGVRMQAIPADNHGETETASVTKTYTLAAALAKPSTPALPAPKPAKHAAIVPLTLSELTVSPRIIPTYTPTVPRPVVSYVAAKVEAVALPALPTTKVAGEVNIADATQHTSEADFDPFASEEPLVRLDPETGKPIRAPKAAAASNETPKAVVAPNTTTCADKAKCISAPVDKQAIVLPKKSRRVARLSWR